MTSLLYGASRAKTPVPKKLRNTPTTTSSSKNREPRIYFNPSMNFCLNDDVAKGLPGVERVFGIAHRDQRSLRSPTLRRRTSEHRRVWEGSDRTRGRQLLRC